jgi:hypothetical protein
MKHIVIFSHGFGVRRDDRGLFTAIIPALKDTETILFDYNECDGAAGTLIVAPLQKQAEKLSQVLTDTKAANPGSIIDLVCHSQGCLVAGLARTKGIRRIVLLTPPATTTNTDRVIKVFGSRPGTVIDRQGISKLVRRDGSMTLVPPEFWDGLYKIDPQALYNKLATQSELLLIKAREDEVIGDTSFDRLAPEIRVETMDTGHNFDDTRPQLATRVAEYLR